MTLNLRPTLTPEQHADMEAVMAAVLAAAKEKIGRREALTDYEAAVMEAAERSQRWLASRSDELYRKWTRLDAGSHEKEAYADMVWRWSDRDLVD